jgi:ribosomal protein S18 acetylase RimI-like enzyme
MPAIRRATPADAETIAALGRDTFIETFVEGFAIAYPPEDLEHFMAHSYSGSFNSARLNDPAQAVWLIDDLDGRALAYAAAGPAGLPHPEVQPGDGELKALYVRREAQGAGFGPALLETALAWLGREGPRALWIGVWSGNTRAQQLYARHGFIKAGEYDFPVGRWLDREWILHRAPAESTVDAF